MTRTITSTKSLARISQLFNQAWLSRYPRARDVIFNNGSEFKMHFMRLLKDFDIKPRPTTVENLQGNSVGDKICPGTEREEINSSRADTENTHVEINNNTDSTTKD